MPFRKPRRSKREMDLAEAKTQKERYRQMLHGERPALESKPSMERAHTFWSEKVRKLESEE